MADGTLRFDTKIDNSGAKEGIEEIKERFKLANKDLANARKEADKISEAWNKTGDNSLLKQLEEADAKCKRIEEEISVIKQELKDAEKPVSAESAMGGAVETTKNAGETAQTGLSEPKDLTPLIQNIQQAEAQYDSLIEKLNTFNAEKVNTSPNEFNTLNSELKSTTSELEKLYKEWAKVTGADVNSNLASLRSASSKNAQEVAKLKDSASQLKESSKAVKSLGDESSKTKDKGSDMFSSFFKLGNMLKMMVVRQLLRAVISAVKQGFSNLYNYGGKTKEAIDQMKLSASTLSNSLASAVAPLLNVVAPIISKICDVFTMASNAVARFFAILTGQKTYVVATKNAESLASANEDVASSAEEAEGALAGIDEINDISNDSSSGSGGSGGTDYSSMFETLPTSASGIFAEFEKIKDLISSGFWEGFGSDWEDKVNEIIKDTKSIGKSLSNIFNDPAVQNAGQALYDSIWLNLGRVAGSVASIGLTIAENIVGAIEVYLSSSWQFIANTLSNIMTNVANTLDWIGLGSVALANILGTFGTQWAQDVVGNILGVIGNALLLGFDVITGIFESLAQLIVQPIVDNADKIRSVLDSLFKAIDTMTQPIFDSIQDLISFLSELWNDYVMPFFDYVAQALSDVFGIILDSFINNVLPAIIKFADNFAEAWERDVAPALNELYNNIKPAIELVGSVVQWLWENILKPFVQFQSEVLGSALGDIINILGVVLPPLISAIGSFVNMVATNIGTSVEMVKGILNGIITFISGVFTGNWSQAFSGLVQIVSSIFNGIVSAVKAPINAIIGIINGFIRGLNKIKIPSWVPAIGGRGINISTIPYLATGTVVPPNAGEFMAVLGDNKTDTEVVSPLGTMKDAMRQVLSENGTGSTRTDELLETLISVVQNKHLLVSDVGKASAEYANAQYKRTGQAIFEGV